jgi:hypothetical protein
MTRTTETYPLVSQRVMTDSGCSATAICRLANVVCGLTSAVCRPTNVVCRLASAVCRLTNVVCGLHRPFAGLQTSFAGLHRPFAGLHRASASLQTPFAGLHRASASLQTSFAGLHLLSASPHRPFVSAAPRGGRERGDRARVRAASGAAQAAARPAAEAAIVSSLTGRAASSLAPLARQHPRMGRRRLDAEPALPGLPLENVGADVAVRLGSPAAAMRATGTPVG